MIRKDSKLGRNVEIKNLVLRECDCSIVTEIISLFSSLIIVF